MRKSNLFKLLAVLVAASMLLAACGGGGSGGDAEVPSADGPKVTSSGFACPEPNPRMEVTSTELNIFVWTEYFPAGYAGLFRAGVRHQAEPR